MSVAELSPREAWLAERRLSIGASESPAILGQGHSNQNALTVWISKTSDEPPDEIDCEEFEWGHALQPLILNAFARRTGFTVHDLGDFTIQRHSEMPWLSATLDGMADTPEGDAVVECKNVDAMLRGEWKGDQPPLRVNIQCQQQMLVKGVSIAYAAGLIGGNQLIWKRVDRSDRFIDAMLPHLKRFWHYVETRTPPPIDGSAATAAALKKMHPRDNGDVLDLSTADQTDFRELVAVKAAMKALKARETSLANRVKAKMGEHSEALLPDGSSYSWRSHECRAYTVAATTKRPLLLKAGSSEADPLAGRIAIATVALIEHGATLYHESESGSRYFELAGGLRIRLADQEPNQATEKWIDRQEVFEVRVDLDGWRDRLAAITGPATDSED